jgi:hypothetical protein
VSTCFSAVVVVFLLLIVVFLLLIVVFLIVVVVVGTLCRLFPKAGCAFPVLSIAATHILLPLFVILVPVLLVEGCTQYQVRDLICVQPHHRHHLAIAINLVLCIVVLCVLIVCIVVLCVLIVCTLVVLLPIVVCFFATFRAIVR